MRIDWNSGLVPSEWSVGCSTGTVSLLSASERGQYLEGWPAMNTKCLVPLPCLPGLILWSTENHSHGSPVLVPPELSNQARSRIGLAVLILHAAGVGLIGRPAVISGRYDKCHSLQLQNHYSHFPPLQHTHTHIHAKHNYAELAMGNDHGFRGIVCWPWQE